MYIMNIIQLLLRGGSTEGKIEESEISLLRGLGFRV